MFFVLFVSSCPRRRELGSVHSLSVFTVSSVGGTGARFFALSCLQRGDLRSVFLSFYVDVSYQQRRNATALLLATRWKNLEF